MKILFYRGKNLNLKTKVDEAEIYFNKDILVKTQNYIYYIDNITKVESEIIKPLGTMIKIHCNNEIVYITVPRIFINIGSGFVIINTFKTQELKKAFKQRCLKQ